MPARSRALTPLTTAAVALALLTGCTGGTNTADPTPVPTTTPVTTVATPTPTPTPTSPPTPTTVDLTIPPVRPSAMDTPSADGAAAAASYFISLYPYMYATGETSEWTAMSASTCEFCTGWSEEVRTAASIGSHREGGAVVVESAEGIEIDPRHWYTATLVVTQEPSTDIAADGTRQTSAGGHLQVHFAMTWTDKWMIDAVDVSFAS